MIIRKRNKTRAKAKKTGSSKFRSEFKELRQQIKSDIKKQHDLYDNKLVANIKVNPKGFYRYPTVRGKTIRVSLLSKREMVMVWLRLKLGKLRSSLVSLQIFSKTNDPTFIFDGRKVLHVHYLLCSDSNLPVQIRKCDTLFYVYFKSSYVLCPLLYKSSHRKIALSILTAV